MCGWKLQNPKQNKVIKLRCKIVQSRYEMVWNVMRLYRMVRDAEGMLNIGWSDVEKPACMHALHAGISAQKYRE